MLYQFIKKAARAPHRVAVQDMLQQANQNYRSHAVAQMNSSNKWFSGLCKTAIKLDVAVDPSSMQRSFKQTAVKMGVGTGIAAAGLLAIALGLTRYSAGKAVSQIKRNKQRMLPYVGDNMNTPQNMQIAQTNKQLHDRNAILHSRVAQLPGFLRPAQYDQL